MSEGSTPTEATTRTVFSGGVDLFVTERGDQAAESVVLVHGYPDTSAVWNDVAEHLSHSFHVVTYDVRGAGRSGAPRGLTPYRLDRLSADIRAVAAATSGNKKVHLVGHDWGSLQAWEAVTDPGAEAVFASYSSICGPCLDHAALTMRSLWRSNDPVKRRLVRKQVAKSWYVAMLHLPGAAWIGWRLGVSAKLVEQVQRADGIRRSDAYPAASLHTDGASGVRLYRANFVPRMLRPRRRLTTVPVQVIVAVGDRYMEPDVAGDVEPWVGDHRVNAVEGTHWLPLTQPLLLADAIALWAERHRVGA